MRACCVGLGAPCIEKRLNGERARGRRAAINEERFHGERAQLLCPSRVGAWDMQSGGSEEMRCGDAFL